MILRRYGVSIGIIALALLLFVVASQQTSVQYVTAQPGPGPGRSFRVQPGLPDPNAVFSKVNILRKASGLTPLSRDDRLTQLAEERALDMTQNKYYAHKGPDGQFFDAKFRQSGYDFDYACENLDLEFTTTPDTFVQSWLTSKAGHRECLLNNRVTSAGYAVALINPGAGEDFPCYIIVAVHSTETTILKK